MSGSNRTVETLAFWVVALVGGVLLIPGVLLPPWLAYRAQLERRAAVDAYVDALAERLAATEKQIDYLEHDPAYLLRVAREELGPTVELPETETIHVAPSPRSGGDDLATAAPVASAAEDRGVPEVAALVDRALEQYPLLQIYAGGYGRVFLMVAGGVMLLTALVLLGRGGMRVRPVQAG